MRGLKQEIDILISLAHLVAPYTGAWIETVQVPVHILNYESHPIRVRGLKLVVLKCRRMSKCRTLYGCVD